MDNRWTVEVYEDGGFERFYRRLDEAEQATTRAAIEYVLSRLGMDICATEWGKSLGNGLYELRIRRTLGTIVGEYGPAEVADVVPAKLSKRRVLIRVYCTFHGDRVVLLLGGYNKLRAPSRKQEQREIAAARSALNQWRRGGKP